MVTPKLRFKGFDESWKSLKYEDVLNIKYGKDHKLLESGDIPVYGTGGVMRYVDRSLYEGESILIGRKGTIDKPKYVNERFWTVDTLFYTEIKENAIAKFIYQHALQVNWLGLNEATGVPSLNTKSISSIEINTPCLEEQTKIASFLSAVDDKITQLTQEQELLSEYKKGMMQQLFSQKLRFKADDGNDFEDWNSDLINKVFTNKSKSFNPQAEKKLPCIELEHLSQGTGNILGTIRSDEQKSTKNLFEPSSVLYGKLRPYLKKFAQPSFKGVCSSEIWVLTGIKVSNNYLYQYIQSEGFSELTNIQSGSKMPRADWNIVASAVIEYPCLEEQAKIANFLSAIDQKIDNVAAQIDQAQLWKKGLLQQMFV